MSRPPSQEGLTWEEGFWGEQLPEWTKEPSLDVVLKAACHSLDLASSSQTQISFLGQGALNKLYEITSPKGKYVMRITLPLDPHYKTSSEVATLDLIRKSTSIPVPKVIAYDASSKNELGFEWILMKYVHGITLDEAWATMTWKRKCKLVEKLAKASAQLFRLRSNGIGNVYKADASTSNAPDNMGLNGHEIHPGYMVNRMTTKPSVWASQLSRLRSKGIGDTHIADALTFNASDNKGLNSWATYPEYRVRRITSVPFFWASRLSLDINRGPFKSSTDWLTTRLALLEHDTDQPLPTDPDSDDEEERDLNRGMITLLRQLMPHFFPAGLAGNESFGLYHEDISGQNIMVNPRTKELTALVDWECVSFVPLWKVCQLPWVLMSRERTSEPQKHVYIHTGNDPDELYFIHLKEYEKTRLRKVFFDHMAKFEPAWMGIHRLSEGKADYDCSPEL